MDRLYQWYMSGNFLWSLTPSMQIVDNVKLNPFNNRTICSPA